jgi:hypothetical protein
MGSDEPCVSLGRVSIHWINSGRVILVEGFMSKILLKMASHSSVMGKMVLRKSGSFL